MLPCLRDDSGVSAEVRVDVRPFEIRTQGGLVGRASRHGLGRLLCLLACLPLWGRCEPSIGSALLRFGRSPVIPAYSWGAFLYRLDNPDSHPVDAVVSLQPTHGHIRVYEKAVRIPAHSSLIDQALVAAGATDGYEATLSVDGVVVGRDEVVVRPKMRDGVVVLLDDRGETPGVSDLAREETLIRNVVVTRCPGETAPTHWAGYASASLVAVVEPDGDRMSGAQIRALTDYTARGGTLVFLSPEGVMALQSTPLRDLLPVVPLRLRPVEELPELDAWGADHFGLLAGSGGTAPDSRPRLYWAKGTTFLEGLVAGDGVTTLRYGTFPACRWRRYGLGTVGVCAVSPFTNPVRKSDCFVPLWNHLLAWSLRSVPVSVSPKQGPMREASRRLTGHRIPGVGAVALTLLLYGLAVLAVLCGGFLLNRHVSAWGVVSCLGLLLTGGILATAYRQARGRPPYVAALLDVRSVGVGREYGESLVSLFSRRDCAPALSAPDHMGLPRPVDQPALYSTRRKRREWEPPFVVRRGMDGVSSVPAFRLRALRPRLMAYQRSSKVHGQSDSPVLRSSGAMAFAAPWELPPNVGSPRDAWVVLPGGCRPARIAGRTCAYDGTGADVLRLDPVAVSLAEFLGSGQLPAPCLAVTDTAASGLPCTIGPQAFQETGVSVYLFPLVQAVGPGAVAVPPEQIAIRPADARTRTLRPGEEWATRTLRGEQTFEFAAFLPPVLADMELDTVVVHLDLINPGGNVQTSVRLVRSRFRRSPTSGAPPRRTLVPQVVDGGRYEFQGGDLRDVLTTRTGGIGIVLALSPKQFLGDVADTERSNRWRIHSLRVSASGRGPPGAGARRY